MPSTRSSLVFVALSLMISSSLTAADWPQWRGPNRDGRSAETNVDLDWTDGAPELLWRTEGLGKGFSSLAVVDGTIYTTGNTKAGQSVLARKVSDGTKVWTTTVTDSVPKHGFKGARCTPSVTAEHVYVVSSDGQIACLQRDNGEIVWSKSFQDEWDGKMMSGWGFSESPLIDGDRIICTPGGNDALIVALNRHTGAEIWASDSFTGEKGKDGAGYSSVVISEACGVKQYITLVGRGIVSVSADDGAILWTYGAVANTTANIPTPVILDDYVFCSSGYGTGSALLHITKDGEDLNANEEYFLNAGTLQNHHGGMIRVGDYLYCGNGHNNGMPTCLKIGSGEVVWGGKMRGVGKGSAAVTMVGDHLLFRYESGELASIAATPDSYQLLGHFMPDHQEGKSWSHPVVVDGKLFLREQNVLMCYDVTK
ncbi:MAG TPA: polyvinylalcohol dehydrogenase [Planctomycetes bacterium]|nr:polyvinylalcohol dehydrogenase [Fuerstiella sp.]HIK94897.1 polyvinylalcohol dehydrogenase [Planctomycetota bacterium]